MAAPQPTVESIDEPKMMRDETLEDDIATFTARLRPKMDLQNYFVGPRDIDRFSKWPMILRLHGSILPAMAIPLLIVTVWSTAIRCISAYVHPLGINQVLLTVLGFVVALALSFRSSTAYERYSDGRRYWTELMQASQILARTFWIQGVEREGEQGKLDVLAKKTAMNLIVAFAIALKHRLRFEPYTSIYKDLGGFVDHLETFAGQATEAESPSIPKQNNWWRAAGLYLGLPFAESNPQKTVQKSDMPLGNLPLEILTYISAFIDHMIDQGQLKAVPQQIIAYTNLSLFHDVLTSCDRVVHTPLAIAYTIAIHQITWLYILLLPFQLDSTLKWISIPACVVASYIILGFLFIGSELENPFGHDVNDLPLNDFCKTIAADIDVISSRPKPDVKSIIESKMNKVLYPLSDAGYPEWAKEPVEVIRGELRFKAEMMFAKRSTLASIEKKGDSQV